MGLKVKKKKKKEDEEPEIPLDENGDPLTGEALEAYEQAAREEAARLQAEAEKAEEEAIMQRAAEKAEERRKEAEERARKAAEAAAEKERRELEQLQFLEIKKMKAEEDYERKRLADIEKARRAEERRIRQKAIDDRAAFMRKQANRPIPEGLGEQIRKKIERMHVGASGAEVEEIKDLITEWYGSPVLEEEDSDGWDVITWCCKRGLTDAAIHLMLMWINPYDLDEDQKRTWVQHWEKRDPDGQTLLMFAAISGAATLVKFIVSKGCNKNAVNDDGFAAITLAAWHGQVETVRALVESQAMVEIRTRGGKTPLQCAVVGGNKETIEYLRYAEELRGIPPSHLF